MERYQIVVKPKPEQPINENEIRVTAQGFLHNYITYATSLLQDKHEKDIILKAMGHAISKAVSIAEIIKTRIPGLHQNISTSSTTITDAYEPIEEGLSPLEMKRQVSLITITLSTVELNKNSPGYQPPTQKQAKDENQQEQHQTEEHFVSSTDVVEDYMPFITERRGSGRGRGRGRGGYGNYQENGGYHNWGRGRGRGRGWGYGGAGYERGRGGRRGYGYIRGRMGGRGRGGGHQP